VYICKATLDRDKESEGERERERDSTLRSYGHEEASQRAFKGIEENELRWVRGGLQ
jgi:hypothetical protein